MLRIRGLLNFVPQYHIVLLYMYQILSNHARDLLEFVIVHTTSISKSVMQITPTSSNTALIACRFLLAGSCSQMHRDISFCFSKCSQLVIGRYCTVQLTVDGFCHCYLCFWLLVTQLFITLERSYTTKHILVIVYLTGLNYYGFMPTVFTAFLYLKAFLTSFRICSSNKSSYIL